MPVTASDIDWAQCPIFQGMSPAERREVVSMAEHKSYTRGKTIIREGKSVQLLWIIMRGRCEVIKATARGGERQLAELEPMAVFGEMSFFHPAPHSASIRTLSDVEVLRLTREKYDMLLQTGSAAAHKIAFNTIKVLAERLRKMDQYTGELVEQAGNHRHHQEWREFRSKLYSDWDF